MAEENIKNILGDYKEEIKEHFDKKTEETNRGFDERTKEIKQHFDEKTEESKQHFDEKTEESKRHFDVVAEDLKNEIKIVAEQVGANAVKLEEHSQKLDKIDGALGVMKMDVGFIKNELKQKVNRDEFVILEKRIGRLEAKMS